MTDLLWASVNASHITAQLAISALEKALQSEKPKKGLILHSDQGSQFTSWEFTHFCDTHRVIQSMSSAGCPYDHAPMERFYRTFKRELIDQHIFYSEEQLDLAVSKYIFLCCNHLRPYAYNNYMTPFERRSIA